MHCFRCMQQKFVLVHFFCILVMSLKTCASRCCLLLTTIRTNRSLYQSFLSRRRVFFVISSYEIWIIFIHTYVYTVIILFKRSLAATTVLWNSLSLSIVPTNLGRPSKVCQYFQQYLYTMDKFVFLCLEWHRKSMFW